MERLEWETMTLKLHPETDFCIIPPLVDVWRNNYQPKSPILTTSLSGLIAPVTWEQQCSVGQQMPDGAPSLSERFPSLIPPGHSTQHNTILSYFQSRSGGMGWPGWGISNLVKGFTNKQKYREAVMRSLVCGQYHYWLLILIYIYVRVL